MYHNILVPLDGSRRAERIVPYVEELVLQFHSRVVFLQVVQSTSPLRATPQSATFPRSYLEIEQQARRPELESKLKEAKTYLASWQGEFREKGIDSHARIEQGSIVEAILAVTEAENTDLVAIASHGRSGLSNVLHGSVAAGLLHKLNIPILLIRSVEQE